MLQNISGLRKALHYQCTVRSEAEVTVYVWGYSIYDIGSLWPSQTACRVELVKPAHSDLLLVWRCWKQLSLSSVFLPFFSFEFVTFRLWFKHIHVLSTTAKGVDLYCGDRPPPSSILRQTCQNFIIPSTVSNQIANGPVNAPCLNPAS